MARRLTAPSPPLGVEGWGEGGVQVASKFNQNRSDDLIQIAHHVRIGEADNSIAQFCERGRPCFIISFASAMGVAIQFDYQPLRTASKVGDVGWQYDLTLELHAEAARAEDAPQAPFSWGQVGAKLLGASPRYDVPLDTPPSPCRFAAFPLPLKGVRGVRHLSNKVHGSPIVNA